jgi:hypothetical protein
MEGSNPYPLLGGLFTFGVVLTWVDIATQGVLAIFLGLCGAFGGYLFNRGLKWWNNRTPRS